MAQVLTNRSNAMSKLAIKQFMITSERYLRLSEKDRSAFNRNQNDRFNYSDNGAISKSRQISYRRYVAQINTASAK